MFTRLKLAWRLALIVGLGVIVALLLMLQGLGGLVQANAAMDDIYRNHMEATRDLLEMSTRRQGQMLILGSLLIRTQDSGEEDDLSLGLDPSTADFVAGEIETNASKITELWNKYAEKKKTDEETLLAERYLSARNEFTDDAIKPLLAALRQRDRDGVMNRYYAAEGLFKPLNERLEALTKLQFDDASKIFSASVAEYKQQRLYAIVALVTASILLALLGWLVIRSVTRPLNTAIGVFGRIAEGHFDNEIVVKGKDELAVLLRALADMQSRLDTDITAQRRVAAENARVRQALDNVTSSVMIADEAGTIIYMNESVNSLLTAAEKDIRRELPQFDVRNILGQSMDVFHRNPTHQRNLLEQMRGAHHAQMSLGGRTFALVANPVQAADGTRVGSVLELRERTEELAVENEVQQIVSAAAGGDLEVRIDLGNKQGFFAVLSEGINELLATFERMIADVITTVSAMAQGDLTRSIESEYEGSFGRLKSDMNTTIEKLTEVVAEIQETADAVKTGSDEIASGNQNLSQRTEEQASSLEETSSAMEQMTATVRQSVDNAKQASTLARSSRDAAESGGRVVGDAVNAMSEINASSKKIADIIGVIDEIAFQTNLLALNASVEAARAGDQGRGFAVVASEVRNLAGRSATAAREIKDLIKDSVGKVEEGSRLVNQSGEVLTEIVSAVKKVTDIIEEIAVASSEQASGINEVSRAVTQMDEMTQQNAALVEEAAAASESLGEQANALERMIGFFKIGDAQRAVAAPAKGRGAARMLAAPKPRAVAAKRIRNEKPVEEASEEWTDF